MSKDRHIKVPVRNAETLGMGALENNQKLTGKN